MNEWKELLYNFIKIFLCRLNKNCLSKNMSIIYKYDLGSISWTGSYYLDVYIVTFLQQRAKHFTISKRSKYKRCENASLGKNAILNCM